MRIYQSNKGFLCAEIDGKNIHSRYNPQREAQRFIEQTIEGSPCCIVLLGAGLGYIQRELLERFPESRVLAVFHHDSLYTNQICKSDRILSWHPSSPISIRHFFNRNLPERNLGKMTVVEWDPSARIFPDLSLQINQTLKECVQQMNGNIHTTAHFGKIWLRNMLSNFLLTDRYCSPEFPQAPVVIASSGPHLRKSLKQIRKYREKILLFALPSSLKALKEAALIPDLQVSSDPGFYGTVHLNHLFPGVPLANPLTSCRGSWKSDIPLWILNQETPYEKDLFEEARIPFRKTYSNGTVSGTAFELTKSIGSHVFFAGLDLCFSDIQSHISPHSFDPLLQSAAFKTDPLHSVYFKRAEGTIPDFKRGIRTGRSLDTYRNWFAQIGNRTDRQIKRLNPSLVSIDNIKEGHLSELEDYPDQRGIVFHETAAPERETRKNIVSRLLLKWEQDLQSENGEELFYFLDAESCTSGRSRNAALDYIKRLKKIYD